MASSPLRNHRKYIVCDAYVCPTATFHTAFSRIVAVCLAHTHDVQASQDYPMFVNYHRR